MVLIGVLTTPCRNFIDHDEYGAAMAAVMLEGIVADKSVAFSVNFSVVYLLCELGDGRTPDVANPQMHP